MGFKISASSELFNTTFLLADKNNFNEAKEVILECVPKTKQAFLKQFEKFPEKVLPITAAKKWLVENIAYGAEELPSEFVKLSWNIVVGDDHVFYIDIGCLDADGNPVENLLNETMIVLETLSGDDYGCGRLTSDCDLWCDMDDGKIKGLQFKGENIHSRIVYDSFASVILLEYVFKLQKALQDSKVFKNIQFIHTFNALDDTGKRVSVA